MSLRKILARKSRFAVSEGLNFRMNPKTFACDTLSSMSRMYGEGAQTMLDTTRRKLEEVIAGSEMAAPRTASSATGT